MATLAVNAAAAPIPLTHWIPKDKDHRPLTTTITNMVAGEATPCTLSINLCLELDVELLIETVIEVQDAATNHNLNVTAAGQKFAMAQKLFAGVARSAFDQVIQGMNQTNTNFIMAFLQNLLLQVVSPHAYAIQKEYLMHLKKPYKMLIKTFHHWLAQIQMLMDYLPC